MRSTLTAGVLLGVCALGRRSRGRGSQTRWYTQIYGRGRTAHHGLPRHDDLRHCTSGGAASLDAADIRGETRSSSGDLAESCRSSILQSG